MSTKTEIKKIVLKIGNRELVLTVEEAREVQKALTELLGLSMTSFQLPIIIERQIPYWREPYITWTADNLQITHEPDHTVVWCQNS